MYKRVGQPAFLHNKKGRSSTVTNSTSSPAESDVGHTRPNRQRRLASWLSFWLSVVAGTLWIGPAIVLLYFNFSQWIIGASAWCPNGQCIVFSYLDQEMSTAQKIARNEKWNHDLLGALQFAAKAMEVWFVFVAGSLVYMVICVAAKGPQGFPIGFLMQHVEYSDLRNLINPVLCTAPQTPHYRTKDRTRHKIHLYLFALFAGSMTILANLMGPSAAVMILPTLQWRGSEPVYGDAVDKFLSDSPPSSQALFGCAEENIRRRNYTCTGLVYRPALDSLLDYSSAFIAQLRRSGDRLLYSGASGTMNEGSLTFTLNITDDLNSELGVLSWAPNRQVIRNLSGDFLEFYNMSQGLLPNSSLAEYNNSLQVLLQRYGPILRFFPQGREGNLTTTIIDEGRSIRCYTPIIVKEDPTSCFRVGKGWNESNSQANFTIGSNEHGIAYPVVFDAFYSDKATVFPQPFIPGQGQAACLPNGTAPADLNCDWDKIFSRPLAGVSSNFASSNFILETAIETDWREYRFYTQFSPALGFATYSTDVSVISTSLASLLIESYPDDPVPISVDSDWILAAFSINLNGNVPTTRTAAGALRATIATLFQEYQDIKLGKSTLDTQNLPILRWLFASQYIFGQAATMINFNTTVPSASTDLTALTEDRLHPVLSFNVRRQVWGYGIDSRTHVLGTIVFILGILVVCVRTILILVTRYRERSPTELMVAAMKYQMGKDVFEGMENNEIGMSKAKFRMWEDEKDEICFEDK